MRKWSHKDNHMKIYSRWYGASWFPNYLRRSSLYYTPGSTNERKSVPRIACIPYYGEDCDGSKTDTSRPPFKDLSRMALLSWTIGQFPKTALGSSLKSQKPEVRPRRSRYPRKWWPNSRSRVLYVYLKLSWWNAWSVSNCLSQDYSDRGQGYAGYWSLSIVSSQEDFPPTRPFLSTQNLQGLWSWEHIPNGIREGTCFDWHRERPGCWGHSRFLDNDVRTIINGRRFLALFSGTTFDWNSYASNLAIIGKNLPSATGGHVFRRATAIQRSTNSPDSPHRLISIRSYHTGSTLRSWISWESTKKC